MGRSFVLLDDDLAVAARSVQRVAHSALTPVFVGLRTGLHVLFAGLTVLVAVRAMFEPAASSAVVVALSVLMLGTYALGGLVAGVRRAPALRMLWLGALTTEWVWLVWLTSEAAYLVFPLFFLLLHLLGRVWGSIAIACATAVAIAALGIHGGWSVAGVVGPLVGAGVALLIGLGYQALAHQAAQREALMQELLATRGQLAATEHEAGVMAERSRLAREIHDTLAQGLSSIQMLLHAAERADPTRPGVEHIQLARETAGANLTDARRFIRELTPPNLEDEGLGGALRRLATSQWTVQGLEVDVRVSDTVQLPMHLQTALLRIAQGAIANVIQHADASRATITLTLHHDRLSFEITDDGNGFDARQGAAAPPGRSDSFGIRATRERVEQLGGTVTIDSAPGRGATLVVDLAREATS